MQPFFTGGTMMESITLVLDPCTLKFYRAVAQSAGIPVEQVLSDALFKLAGELSLQALAGQNRK